ncbi:hypothetical protein QJS66_00150 [Kocuria rhizophila]|nr:hypothetical protein QJS66_00150 [Kocuria rhizophila]
MAATACRVTAVEREPRCPEWARRNSRFARAGLLEYDWDVTPTLPGRFCVVVSNPPYIPAGEIPRDRRCAAAARPPRSTVVARAGMRHPIAVMERCGCCGPRGIPRRRARGVPVNRGAGSQPAQRGVHVHPRPDRPPRATTARVPDAHPDDKLRSCS